MRNRVTKILVAIDGSDHSLRAAEYAIKIANNCRARLFAVTVTYIPEKYHVSQQKIITDTTRRADTQKEDEAKTWFERFTQRAKEEQVELVTELINSHRPVDYVILEYAELKGIDFIVIGTKGRTGLSKVLLGSVASGVVAYSHCPVLVTK
jgi:nucleotide-binding universal stress UspA family protein